MDDGVKNPTVIKEEKISKTGKIRTVRGHNNRTVVIDDMPGFAVEMEKHLIEAFREKFRGTEKWPFVSKLSDEEISRSFCELMAKRQRESQIKKMRNDIARFEAQHGKLS